MPPQTSITKKKTKPKCTTKTAPPKRYLDKVHSNILKSLKKFHLKLPKELKGKTFKDFDYQGMNSRRLGNRYIKAQTKSNYESSYRQLWRFCAYKGDYDSMLMLLPSVPQGAPSMKLETVEEFLRFKRLHNYTNQPLKKCNKDDVLMDVLGKPIRVEGSCLFVKIFKGSPQKMAKVP